MSMLKISESLLKPKVQMGENKVIIDLDAILGGKRVIAKVGGRNYQLNANKLAKALVENFCEPVQ